MTILANPPPTPIQPEEVPGLRRAILWLANRQGYHEEEGYEAKTVYAKALAGAKVGVLARAREHLTRWADSAGAPPLSTYPGDRAALLELAKKCEKSDDPDACRLGDWICAILEDEAAAPPADVKPQSETIAGRTLAEWQEYACRDDCLDRMVPSDLRQILSRLRTAFDNGYRHGREAAATQQESPDA